MTKNILFSLMLIMAGLLYGMERSPSASAGVGKQFMTKQSALAVLGLSSHYLEQLSKQEAKEALLLAKNKKLYEISRATYKQGLYLKDLRLKVKSNRAANIIDRDAERELDATQTAWAISDTQSHNDILAIINAYNYLSTFYS